MTALRAELRTCPECGHAFTVQHVVSTNSFGGKRTDFHERSAGTQPHGYYVHVCPQCWYAGMEADYEQGKPRSYKPRASCDGHLDRYPSCGSERWEAYYWQLLAEGYAEARRLGDVALRAAWCCVDEGDIEAERYWRLRAAEHLTAALASFDGVAREDRAVLTYLVGELWRRIGDPELAAEWFNEVVVEVVDTATQQWVVAAARQQRDCPREWFG